MKSFTLKIITPEKVFFDGETDQIIVRTTEGDIGVLAGHESYVADLPAGPFKVKIDGSFKIAGNFRRRDKNLKRSNNYFSYGCGMGGGN